MASQRVRVASAFLLAALTLGPLVAYRLAARGADVDGAAVLAFSLAMALGIVSTMFHGFRTLAMSGYRHDDLRHALQTVEGERDELVGSLNAALELSIKLKSRVRATWIMLILGLLCVGAAAARMWMMQGGTDTLRTPGVVVLVLGAAMVSLGLTFLMTTPTRPWLPRRALVSFWSGRCGRGVFELFTRGVPRVATRLSPNSGGARRSAMTVFGTLTPGQQRELRDLPDQLRALETEADAIDDRVRQLRRTLAEGRERAADSSADESLEGTRQRLRDDVEAALASAKARRTAIANTMEQVRLELLRIQAGVGDTGAVRAAVRRDT
jgi:hypothetical protein